LKKDIYRNKHPNLKSFNKKENLVSELINFLHNNNIDLNYITTEYSEKFKERDTNKNLSDLEKPLSIFFNFAKKFGFFWNKLERETYINSHLEKFNEVNDFLKK